MYNEETTEKIDASKFDCYDAMAEVINIYSISEGNEVIKYETIEESQRLSSRHWWTQLCECTRCIALLIFFAILIVFGIVVVVVLPLNAINNAHRST